MNAAEPLEDNAGDWPVLSHIAGKRNVSGSPFPPWLVMALLALVTLMLYWPATKNDFVSYDDPIYVYENPRVLTGLSAAGLVWALTTSHGGNWHPLTWISLMGDASIWGKTAAGFHFTNLILHAANAGLLFWLVWKLTAAPWRSAAVAAFFAWHPVHVESVAWVSERKDVLSTFFGLLTLLFYARHAQARAEIKEQNVPGRAAGTNSRCFWLAICCYALGLMSKSMLVTWPFVLLLLDYWPLARWQRGAWGLLLREKVPFFVLAAIASVVTFQAQREGGFVVAVGRLPMGLRLANAVISYCRYLGELFWPHDLAIFYPHPGFWPVKKVLLAGLFLGGLSSFFFWQRRRQPFLLMGWLWFGGTLVPVIGLIQVGGQAIADRYTYIPSIGILLATVWGAHALAHRWSGLRPLMVLLAAAMLVFCAAFTSRQLGNWRNSETLFEHALAVTSNNFSAHNGLGRALAEEGRLELAIEQYQDAIRIDPSYAEAYNNWGVALAKEHRMEAARAKFQTALKLSPNYPQAHENLGLMQVALGHSDSAIDEFRQALRLSPDYVQAHESLGLVLAAQGHNDAAAGEWREVIRLDSNDAQPHDHLGVALAKQGQITEAITQFQEALRINPNDIDAHVNLAKAIGLQNQNPDLPPPPP